MAKSKTTTENTGDDVIIEVPEIEAAESAEAETPAIPQTEAENAAQKYVYVGPTVIRTELIAGRVFICGGVTLEQRLAETFGKYPQARKLFVSPENAAEAISKIRSGGNSLSAAYKYLSKIRIGG